MRCAPPHSHNKILMYKVIWINDIPGEQTTKKKKPCREESFIKLIETSISPSTNPGKILTKTITEQKFLALPKGKMTHMQNVNTYTLWVLKKF